MSASRRLAVQRLLRIEEEGAFVARIGGEGAAPESAREAVGFVAGVTRWRRWLDHVLGRFVKGGLGRLDAPLVQVLRIGAYDLLVLETPPHAAVNEAVAAARALTHKGGAGLVNAVLRKVATADREALVPDTGDPAADLAVRFSHPTWMVRRWRARFGVEAATALLQANNRIPAYALRANTLRGSAAALATQLEALGVAATPSRWLDDAVTVDRLQPVLAAGLLAEGRCAVQDEAAALVVHVLDPQPGERLLDAAAAPGGKALYAAERMGDEGEVVALDVNEAKTKLIAKAAVAHGTSSVRALAGDLRTADLGGPFDRVLLDAPCSGTGVLAKRADLRWRRDLDGMRGLTGLQDDLLDAAAEVVRPGGRLVYSTCSLEPEENEERVAAFLDRQPAFEMEPVGTLVPEAMRSPEGFYRALPHRHGTDGAFASRLRRRA